MMTFTQVQGKKGQGQGSQKVTLPYFSETIKATGTTFGTKALNDNTLPIIHKTMTLPECQVQKGQGQRSKKEVCHFSQKQLKLKTSNLAQ